MRELKRGVLVHYVHEDNTHQAGLITEVLQEYNQETKLYQLTETVRVQLDNPDASYGRQEMSPVPHDETNKAIGSWHWPEE